jgi:hypothetical protein
VIVRVAEFGATVLELECGAGNLMNAFAPSGSAVNFATRRSRKLYQRALWRALPPTATNGARARAVKAS